MEFTCHTTYDQKALTAMARAVRKTVGAKRNRIFHLYVYIVIGLLLVALWLSWGTVWQTVLHCATIAALLLLDWKEDAINGYFARRKGLPGNDFADTTFYADYYLTKTAAAESNGRMTRSSRWQRPEIISFLCWEGIMPWPWRRQRWRAAASRNSIVF